MLSVSFATHCPFNPSMDTGATGAAPVKVHKVQQGDFFNTIAKNYGVSPQALRQANPQIADPNWIFPGQEINIPSKGNSISSDQQGHSEKEITVKRNDTFNGIARQHNVSAEALHKANPHIVDPNWIFPGQKITIPSSDLQTHSAIGIHRANPQITVPDRTPPRQELGVIAPNDVAPTDKTALGDFREMAPRIMEGLIRDLDITVEDAAAILGNLGHESKGFRAMQEDRPVNGGRGGYGWAQWTGSRRREFESYCKERELNIDSYEANYGFLVHELLGTHKNALTKTKAANGLENKVKAFELEFERADPKHKHYDRREKYANTARDVFNQLSK